MTTSTVNKEIDQDRVGEAEELFRKYGYTMFPQQRRIYGKLAKHLYKVNCTSVLEAGSGNGIGTALLERHLQGKVTGSDKLTDNIEFSKCIYPWIPFLHWDINKPLKHKYSYDIAVAIEVFEHVDNPQVAMKNLLDSCDKELWLSTPNGKGKERPPSNPYHVQEYTTQEIHLFVYGAIGLKCTVDTLAWHTFEKVNLSTDIDPLVYRITKA
ncbi:class I SAM-dependent methyltransferase [bacterium]|nr:class I SAM-dependent methyltransferase [bacterium]